MMRFLYHAFGIANTLSAILNIYNGGWFVPLGMLNAYVAIQMLRKPWG